MENQITIAAFIVEALAHKPKTNKEVKSYQESLGHLLEWFTTDSFLHDIKFPTLKEGLSHLPDPQYRQTLKVLRHAFAQAVSRGQLRVNPLHGVRGRRRIWTRDRESSLPAQAVRDFMRYVHHSAPEDVAFHALAFFGGLAPEELFMLSWADIELARREVLVSAAMARNKRPRLLPISDSLYAWLAEVEKSGGLICDSKARLYRTRNRLCDQNGLPYFECNIPQVTFLYHRKTIVGPAQSLVEAGYERLTIGMKCGQATIEEAETYWSIRPDNPDRS